MLIREIVGRTIGHNWHYVAHVGRSCPFLWHYHPEFELTLTRHSCGVRYVGNDVQPFGDHDLVLVAPNCAHTWHSNEGIDHSRTRIHVVFFTLEWLQGLAECGLPELIVLNRWLSGVRQGVVFSPALAERVVPLFSALDKEHGVKRLAVLLQILDSLPKDDNARHLGIGHTSRGGSDRRVDTALRHLQENYQHAVSLGQVANAAATSASTLKRVFRERLGMSVTDILIQLRVGHACHLLISTDYPVHRIASESGFNNLGHFFRQFAAQRGCTPEEFRRRNHLPAPGETPPPHLPARCSIR
ncbi:AraC family transcriptional regulator [Propionivibrio soli]|uniref:AraC family transcriptional regulator n=1 Tax=Propionivibrio soli TaxID=2976531 RepID=UPI0021E9286C|nr:AraC family transcriptional regulator [Propionivibrio soli]